MGSDDFKIIDKRAVHPSEEKPSPPEAKGEGFVMKDSQKSATLEKIDFSTLVFSLATSALINMGLNPDPVTKKIQKNLEFARQNIEILIMLQEKTKGNLSQDEAALLENLLTEVRLKYVKLSVK